jgi:anti-sigma28 factor (negative regulator of flagellin synthesis)
MTVEPTNRSHVQASRTNKPIDLAAGKETDGKAKETAKAPKSTVVDKVEVSSTAQELHELIGSERIDTNTMPAERLKEILERISDGTYDKPEVIDEIARRAVDDL